MTNSSDRVDEPLFSILIANYNNGQYLQECLDSVFAQTYTNWEVILVDDKSEDNSKDIYENYKRNEKIKIFYNEKNKGVGYSKNKCANKAVGSYATILDPDDALLPNALETIYKTFKTNPNIGLIYGELIYSDETLAPLHISGFLKQLNKNETVLKSPITGHDSFKLEVYRKTKGYNPKLTSAVDQDLYLKIEEISQLFFLPTPLYLYRSNIKGLSQSNQTPIALGNRIRVQLNAHFRRLSHNYSPRFTLNELRLKLAEYAYVKFINNANNKKFFFDNLLLSIIISPKRIFIKKTWKDLKQALGIYLKTDKSTLSPW